MLDSHCHLDRCPDPIDTARRAGDRGVFIVAVTNLPSHFKAGLPHARQMKRVRLALGLHPLAADQHKPELKLVDELFDETSFIGEVGLDFSRGGRATADAQLASFRLVAERLSAAPKFVTLHSRGAERAALEILRAFRVGPCVFHWYSGPLTVLEQAVADGHFFSVNPAMTASKNGRKVIAAIPPDRLLTESDAPYATFQGRPNNPWDVGVVECHIADLWRKSASDVRASVWSNFRRLLEPLRASGATG